MQLLDVCGLGRFDHITPAMRNDLHWLPVRQRIEYKIALLVYKCLRGAAPLYLSDYCAAITETNRRHNLRSISRSDLLQPRTRTHHLGPPQLPFLRSKCLELPSSDCQRQLSKFRPI